MSGYGKLLENLQRIRSDLPNPSVYNDNLLMMRNSDPSNLNYFRRGADFKTVPEWGQLKLIIGEMIFFLLYCMKISHATVVYAGAAPGHHINILIKMFPMFKWELYDPRDIALTESDKVKVHKELFTDEIAQSWSNVSNVIFITDIRTGSHINRDSSTNEDEISKDMLRQQQWVTIMKPVIAHIKFRLPYYRSDSPLTFKYLSGVIFYQPFSGPTSTECRLVVGPQQDRSFAMTDYNVKDFENRCFYRNSVLRESQHYQDSIIGQTTPPDDGEMDDRLDSMMFISCCHLYLLKNNGRFANMSPADRYKYTIALTKSIRKQINSYRDTPTSISELRSVRTLPITDL